MGVFRNITEVIGSTPLVKLEKLSQETGIEILAKLESVNPAGSVKDRVARAMVLDAEEKGLLKPGATLVEPTSGNTGIALAMLAAARGYRLILTMPEAMSRERVRLLRAYGAEVLLTPGTLMGAAVNQAIALGESIPGAVLLKQFENPANPDTHQQTTGVEILRDCPGPVDLFVAGIGTGGTITGVARALKPKFPAVHVVGVEPEGAAVLSGEKPAAHAIQGIGAGFVPTVLERELLDEVLVVGEEESLTSARRATREEGVLCGISAGAALAAVRRLGRRSKFRGKTLVVVLPDTGERYITTRLFDEDG